MRNLKSKYQYLYIGLLLVIFIFSATIVSIALKYFFEQIAEERLESEKTMIELFLNQENVALDGLEEVVRNQNFYDVTIFYKNKEEPYTTVELVKEHFLSNLAFSIQTDLHSSIRVGDRYKVLYDSFPLNGNKIVISTKVNLLSDQNIMIGTVVSLIFLLLFLFTILLTLKFYSVLDETLNNAIVVVDSFLKGDFKARMEPSPYRKTNELAFSINELAISMKKEKAKQNLLNDRLSALVENIGSSILVIEKDGKVNFVNKFFTRTFHLRHYQVMDKFYYDCINYQEVNKIIEEVFLKEQNVKRQVALTIGNNTKHFQIYGVPVIGRNGLWEGIVLVFHDITELIKLEQMRKDFVANVSHELRTPITSIKGFSETLLDGAKNEPEVLEHFLTIIHKESERLQALVHDLLELSRIETNKLELNYSKVMIKELMEECILLMEPKLAEKNIQTNIIEKTPCSILADYNRLKQIIVNLLTNAITYSKENSKITITLEKEQENFSFSIEDNGIGMKEEELPRIFERFYRIDRARNRDSGGTGLGLSIVKHLVEAHHGTITVKSKWNEGTTFTVTLPLKKQN